MKHLITHNQKLNSSHDLFRIIGQLSKDVQLFLKQWEDEYI